jgi:hypothetical protein
MPHRTTKTQADTCRVSTRTIVASKAFARGLAEVRKNLPFNPNDNSWDYERGRCFGFIAPLSMPLRIGRALNPRALKLAVGGVRPEATHMTKAKKTKVPRRVTALDRLAGKLRAAQRRETTNIIEIGKLLIESRDHPDMVHGDWQSWLAENFDRDYRTAIRHVNAAEYVERKSKSDTVSVFTNLCPTVLYRLAAGHHTEQEEAAILAASRKGRVDQDAAGAICEKLAPPDADENDDDDGDDAEEDPEIAAILDRPPPKVPPAPTLPPTDFDLRAFNEVIGKLKVLMTKPCKQFASTIHTVNDLAVC